MTFVDLCRMLFVDNSASTNDMLYWISNFIYEKDPTSSSSIKNGCNW